MSKFVADGAILLSGFLSASENGIIKTDIEDLIERENLIEKFADTANPDGVNSPDKDYHINHCVIIDYNKMFAYPKPRFNVRNSCGSVGVVDLFQFNKLFPVWGEIWNEKQKAIFDFINTTYKSTWKLESHHLYMSDSITQTRDYHVDTYLANVIKLFVFLTDVNTEDDGAHSYKLGSHRKQYTETTEAKNFLLKAGDAILSIQNGLHRGLPQRIGAERKVIVLTFSR